LKEASFEFNRILVGAFEGLIRPLNVQALESDTLMSHWKSPI